MSWQKMPSYVYVSAIMDASLLFSVMLSHMCKQALGLQLSLWCSYFQNWHVPLLQLSFHAKHTQNVAIHACLKTVARVLVAVNVVWILHTRWDENACHYKSIDSAFLTVSSLATKCCRHLTNSRGVIPHHFSRAKIFMTPQISRTRKIGERCLPNNYTDLNGIAHCYFIKILEWVCESLSHWTVNLCTNGHLLYFLSQNIWQDMPIRLMTNQANQAMPICEA